MSELDQVSVFTKVVAAGGFSAGARMLGIPKSSASRSVKQLETALGVQLLQRTTRSLRLTDAGRDYYERVAGALAGLEEARAAVMERQETLRGVVRMAAPADRWGWVLAPFIARFAEDHPHTRVELSLSNREVDFLKDGFDLALRVGKLRDSSLLVRVVGTMRRGLFASQRYLVRRGTPKDIADLAHHEFVLGQNGTDDPRRLELEGAGRLERIRVSGQVMSDDVTFIHEAVRAGLGIGLLPLSGCVEHLGLLPVLPEYAEPGLTCSIVYPASRYVPQRVATFRDALLAYLEESLDGLKQGTGVSGNADSRRPTPKRRGLPTFKEVVHIETARR